MTTVPLSAPALPPAAAELLQELIDLQLLAPFTADQFLSQHADHLAEFTSAHLLGQALIQAELLTQYQLDRLAAGTAYGLVLGNYKVLDRLGGGSVCVVFLGEHLHMKRRVAIKVLPVDDQFPASVLERFYGEMRVLADLHHPNVVMAYDSGLLPPAQPHAPALHYLVMELVDGGDLEQYVHERGPAEIGLACDWIRQAACGLQEAHDGHLIHRDVKPSNILLSSSGQVKVVDFGLARQFDSRMTEPNSLLGSIEFMAPEQSRDPTAVGGSADIYGLGASLLWLLTGELPYPPQRTLADMLRVLQNKAPRRLRDFRKEAPAELDELIAQMLDRDPAKRPAMPVTVMNALSKFAAPTARATTTTPAPARAAPAPTSASWCVLLAGTDPADAPLVHATLEPLGCLCSDSLDCTAALAVARREGSDLALLDLDRLGRDAEAFCRHLLEQPRKPHLKLLALTSQSNPAALAIPLSWGIHGFVPRPLDANYLAALASGALRVVEAQVHAGVVVQQLQLANKQLEQSLASRGGDVRQAQDALLYAMAKLAEARDGESAGHLRRLQLYCRVLADRVVEDVFWSEVINAQFIEQLERCVPLHDIGKIGLPDSVLTKPGQLDAKERALMQSHTLIGASMLDALNREYGESLPFLSVATVIVRFHHERFDGTGYPDQLAGEAIPPAARLVGLADVYDALRRARFHKPALSHADAVKQILEKSRGHFDPALVQVFAECHGEFERIYQEVRV